MSEVTRSLALNLEPVAKGFVQMLLDSPEWRKIMEDMVQAGFEKFVPKRYEIVELEAVTRVEGAREELAQIVQAFRLGRPCVMLVGPAGSGKTTLTRQTADYLQVEWFPISCNPEITSSALLGRMMPDSLGGARYLEGPFLRAYENGGLVVLEEFDTADPSIMLVLNTAIDSDTLPVPNRSDKPTAKRHKDFYLIVDANTFGDGASREYVGRMQQDAAFLDRFVGATFFMDYCDNMEAQIAGQYKKHGQQVLAFVRSLRKQVRETKTRRIVSTRLLISMCQWCEAGVKPVTVMNQCLVHWTEAEHDKLQTKALLKAAFPGSA